MRTHKWSDIQAKYGKPEREAYRAEVAAEFEAERATLRQLRKAKTLTQQELARRLETSQAEISRMERRADMYVSTLAHYVEALGGRLEISAVFDEHRVAISLDDLASQSPDGPAVEKAECNLAERAEPLVTK